MLQTLIELLLGLGDMVNSVCQYIVTFIVDSIYICMTVFHVGSEIPTAFSWLPEQLVQLLVVLFAIVVIYKFCGRE